MIIADLNRLISFLGCLPIAREHARRPKRPLVASQTLERRWFRREFNRAPVSRFVTQTLCLIRSLTSLKTKKDASLDKISNFLPFFFAFSTDEYLDVCSGLMPGMARMQLYHNAKFNLRPKMEERSLKQCATLLRQPRRYCVVPYRSPEMADKKSANEAG